MVVALVERWLSVAESLKNFSNLSLPGHGIRSRDDASESDSDDEDIETSSEEEKETEHG